MQKQTQSKITQPYQYYIENSKIQNSNTDSQEIIKSIQKQLKEINNNEKKQSSNNTMIQKQFDNMFQKKQECFPKTSDLKSIDPTKNFQKNEENLSQCKEKFEEYWKNKLSKYLSETKYSVGNYIDSGGQGHIFDGHFFNGLEKVECVFKIYDKTNQNSFNDEIKNLQQFENPINIIKIFDSIDTKEGSFILVLEKCKYSLSYQLSQYENKNKQQFNLQKCLRMIFDLLDGLIQLRTYGTFHSDIKLDNILKKQNGRYCISDFGSSTKEGKEENGQQKFEVKSFTKIYAPYELFMDVGYFNSDVYSLGLTLEKIINTFQKVNEGILSNDEQKLVDSFLTIIKEKMIKPNHEERLSCDKLHKLFYEQIFILPDKHIYDFEQSYFKKCQQITQELQPYGQHKDFPFYFEIILYYHQQQLKQIINKIMYFFKPEISKDASNYQHSYFRTDCITYVNQSQNVGYCYQRKGDYKSALQYYFFSLEIFQLIFPNNSIQQARSLQYIAKIYELQDNKFKAKKYYDLSLEMFKSVGQKETQDMSSILNDMGQFYKRYSKYKNALNFFKDSLKISEKLYKGDHVDKAAIKNNIGYCYYYYLSKKLIKYQKQQEHSQNFMLLAKQGKEQCQESLAMYQRLIKGIDENKVQALLNIGNLEIIFDIKKSKIYLFEALVMFKKLFGESHPQIVPILMGLGCCFQNNHEYDESLKYHHQSYHMAKLFNGDNVSQILQILSNIGFTFQKKIIFKNSRVNTLVNH